MSNITILDFSLVDVNGGGDEASNSLRFGAVSGPGTFVMLGSGALALSGAFRRKLML